MYKRQGVDVVHIGIQNDLEHNLGVVRAAAAFLIQLSETFKIQALNPVSYTHLDVYKRQILKTAGAVLLRDAYCS